MSTGTYGKMSIEVFNASQSSNDPVNTLTPCAVCGNLITTDEVPVLVIQAPICSDVWCLAHRWCVEESH